MLKQRKLHYTRMRSGKDNGTHSSALSWKISWTEEPGRLQSMGSRRVGHNWATSLSLFTFMPWRRKWQPTPVFLPGESQGREPGGLPSMGLQRVRHDWHDLAAAAGWNLGVLESHSEVAKAGWRRMVASPQYLAHQSRHCPVSQWFLVSGPLHMLKDYHRPQTAFAM